MPQFDRETGHVVLRIVYDGPAWAGKTTSLRALAKALGVEAISGEEADGRTLEYDWVDYTGGLFRGLPIRCQLVGVPGQRVLERRRRAILATSDAVVFVADSRRSRLEENRHAFGVLRSALGELDPPVATLVQANKRDVEDAVELGELLAHLGADDTVALTESVAAEGEGVRETFVFAVRLALDRVRALWHDGGAPADAELPAGLAELRLALAGVEGAHVPLREFDEDLFAAAAPADEATTGPDTGEALATSHLPASPEAEPAPAPAPPISGGDDFRERPGGAASLQTSEAIDSSASVSSFASIGPIASSAGAPADPTPGRGPSPPDDSVPPGLVWPPVTGRVLVHESARSPVALARAPRGDWTGASGGWALHSPCDALFFDLDEGRGALVEWARWHVAYATRLSSSRALVLHAAAPGAWRLWQVVRRLPTLGDRLAAISRGDDRRVGVGILELARKRRDAPEALLDPERSALEQIAFDVDGRAVYAGLAAWPPPEDPEIPGDAGGSPLDETTFRAKLVDEFAAVLRDGLETTPGRLAAVLSGLEHAAAGDAIAALTAAELRAALLGR